MHFDGTSKDLEKDVGSSVVASQGLVAAGQPAPDLWGGLSVLIGQPAVEHERLHAELALMQICRLQHGILPTRLDAFPHRTMRHSPVQGSKHMAHKQGPAADCSAGTRGSCT